PHSLGRRSSVRAAARRRRCAIDSTAERDGERRGAIGVWGTFGTDSLSAQLRHRVVSAELTRRRPDLDVRSFSPFGKAWPFLPGGGEVIESLDEDDGIRRRDLAAAIDLVVVSVDAS